MSIRAEKALAEAGAALARLRVGEAGALLGVPVVVKDNVDIVGEVTTHGTAGSKLLLRELATLQGPPPSLGFLIGRDPAVDQRPPPRGMRAPDLRLLCFAREGLSP